MGIFAARGNFQLPAEHSLLHFARRMIVVIIEADFTHTRENADAASSCSSCAKCCVRGELGFVRMNSGRGVNPIMRFGERNRGGEMIGARSPADRQNRRDARIARTLQHGVAVFVELRIFQDARANR